MLTPDIALTSALLRLPAPGGRRWLAFDHPIEQITAWPLAAVVPALERAQQAQRAGHWVVGMISYDAAPAFDPALTSQRHADTPLVALGVFEQARPSRGPAGGHFVLGDLRASRRRPAYGADLDQIHHHIAEGDTYQVNHTMRLRASFDGDPLGLFATMGRAQRADHHAYLDLGDLVVCSASPELFLRRRGRALEARPMKGTRPRHPDPAVDATLADELAASEKDRAENTMIVDMMRNDLGRVADIGSVRVAALHTVETYPTVHQLTSTVRARSGASVVELLEACFPASSITGAPKISTTEIIARLETEPRGIYTGSIGALAPDGSFELNIAIRTAVIDRRSGQLEYGVGGGIVWDSDTDHEWAEAHHKAIVLDRARTPFRLLETLVWDPDVGPLLLDRHLERLGRSARHFGFDVDVMEVRRRIEATSAPRRCRLRVLAGPDGAITVETQPMPHSSQTPWIVPLDTEPVSSADEFLRHKTTNRSRYQAARDRFPAAPDVLLWNERREVTESTIANLVVRIDGALVTPHEQCGLLPGTFRAELLAGGRLREEVVSIDDLARADGVFLVNAVRGWIPVEVDLDARVPAP